jgi:hypothetical protein
MNAGSIGKEQNFEIPVPVHFVKLGEGAGNIAEWSHFQVLKRLIGANGLYIQYRGDSFGHN